MSDPPAFRQRILDRCREAFGEPARNLSRDDHWAFKPHPYMVPINVMVNSSTERPAIWVFDPYDGADPATPISIKNVDDIEEAIHGIRDRVQLAAMIPRHDGSDGTGGHANRAP